MNKERLDSLEISHLRGATAPFTLKFDPKKKLTVLYGENGSGKTTICDAFDLLGSGQIGSLSEKGLGNAVKKFWPSVGKNLADIKIKLAFSGEVPSIELDGSSPTIGSPPIVQSLRRSQLTKLIEAPPADKYKEIDNFVDVSEIENSERALKDLINQLNDDLKEANPAYVQSMELLLKAWKSKGEPGEGVLHWAKGVVNQDLSDLEEKYNSIKTVIVKLERLTSQAESWASIEESVASAETALEEASEGLTNAAKAVLRDEAERFEILKAARPYLESHEDIEICPLCESSAAVSGLLDRVSTRLDSMNALSEATDLRDEAKRDLDREKGRVSPLTQQYKATCEEFMDALGCQKWGGSIVLPELDPPEDIGGLASWIENTKDAHEDWQAKFESWADQKSSWEMIKNSLETYEMNSESVNELQVLIPKLKQVWEIMKEERRKFTDGVLSSIAGEVGRIYEAVHPGEGLEKISLQLDPKKRASLNIGASFGDEDDVPPQAYFSQSHLDTLGLCVVLALAQMKDPDEVIFVLDDVLASIDEPHVDRLVNMLYEEALKFRHCLITTHYRPWKEKLRWGWLKNGECHFVELKPWSMDSGLVLTGSVPEIDRLKALLKEDPKDYQSIASKAGVILEAILDFLTVLYACRVPRRRDERYTLGDLLPAINKKLLAALRVEVKTADEHGQEVYVEIQLSDIIADLREFAQIRNLMGAHFSEVGMLLGDANAVTFAEKVLELADALVDEAGNWPRSDKSGSYWATAGESRKLHPLKEPS